MKNRLLVSFLALLVSYGAFSAPPSEDGKSIFISRCASCHNVNKVIVGPALAGVSDRRSQEWIIQFVHSSQAVIKGGDQTAVALYEKFNKVPMPDHPDLSAENIKNVLAYIKSETRNPSATIGFRPEKLHPAYTPVSITNWRFFSGYIFLILILAAAMILLVRVKEIQRGQPDNQME